MILITSAAYVAPGLTAEFGKLPPSMLPVQNRRLYFHQLQLLEPLKDDIVLSLPVDFRVDKYDLDQLSQRHVQIIYVPNKLSLGASVVYVLNVLGRINESLRILHGDTLIDEIPSGLDIFSVSQAEDDYNWSPVEEGEDGEVYAGFFAFVSQTDLIRNITEFDNNFMCGVKAYAKEHHVKYSPVKNWLDFGLVNSYYRSKSTMTTQRIFNGLKIDKYSVTKSSKDINKMMAEANWIKNIPVGMKHYTPALWQSFVDNNKIGQYTIEYFYLSSLSDIFVFGRNPYFVLKKIVDSCIHFLEDESKILAKDAEDIAVRSIKLYGTKTSKRIMEYTNKSGIDMNHKWRINGIEVPSIHKIVEDINRNLDVPVPQFMHLMHGDFCFSNILYDFKSQSIKVLDPRGRDLDRNITIYGDFRYDVAKFAHSVLGLYDFIIGGYFNYAEDDPYSLNLSFSLDDSIKKVQEYFKKQKIAGYSLDELYTYPILVHLFLSMIPLHSDHPKRQQAMFANALRLYAEYKHLK
jgi:hypothetical protein